MKSYSTDDITTALKDTGVQEGDLVFFALRAFTVGRLKGAYSKEVFCRMYLDSILNVIGDEGTLVVPTYSQQVGRFGLPYIHEETQTLNGIFSEFIRTQPQSVRSFHPVFSLSAFGPDAKHLFGNVGVNAFGINSAYDRIFKRGGHCICLGFEYNLGFIVYGTHYVECTYGVPYFYNKVLDAEVYKDGKRSDKVFVLNVRYTDFDIEHDFIKYMDALLNRGLLYSIPVGDSILYSTRLENQLNVGYELLDEDVYAFLKSPPVWKKGVRPFDGPPDKIDSRHTDKINWDGFLLNSGRQYCLSKS
jgi:aminoglycoside 3-N-acetyltransferase